MILGAQIEPKEIYDIECNCKCGKRIVDKRPKLTKCATCEHIITFDIFWKEAVVKYLCTSGHQAFRDSLYLSKELPIYGIQSKRYIDDLEDPPMAIGLIVSEINDDSSGRHPSELSLSQIKYMKHRVLMTLDEMKIEKRPLGIYLATDAIRIKPSIPKIETRQAEEVI